MVRIVLRSNRTLNARFIVANDMLLKSYLILLWVICFSRGRYRKKSRIRFEIVISELILDLLLYSYENIFLLQVLING